MRTLCERWLRKVIVGPAGARATLGMASFWIRHRTAPYLSVFNSGGFIPSLVISLRYTPCTIKKTGLSLALWRPTMRRR
jgi:hypothetical protein